MHDQNSNSGLELDTSKLEHNTSRFKVKTPSPYAPPVARVSHPAPEPEDEMDSSTAGAFIVLVLASIILSTLANFSSGGDAVINYAISLVGAGFTYLVYLFTSYLVRHLGTLGFLMGGWFSFLVGMVAQLAHQLAPKLLTWRFLAIVTAIGFVVAMLTDIAR